MILTALLLAIGFTVVLSYVVALAQYREDLGKLHWRWIYQPFVEWYLDGPTDAAKAITALFAWNALLVTISLLITVLVVT